MGLTEVALVTKCRFVVSLASKIRDARCPGKSEANSGPDNPACLSRRLSMSARHRCAQASGVLPSVH